MSVLDALLIFAKVVDLGSFSAASRHISMPVSTVSRKISDLEKTLGVRLLERSTRKLRLTDVGAEVYSQARRGAEVQEAVDLLISNQLTEVRGALRLSAPPNIADSLLAPLITEFQSDYPDVQIQIVVTDRIVDHIAEGVDIAFRVGRQADSSLVTRTILHYRHQLVASPGYIAEFGAPDHPDDLRTHRLLAFSFWTPERSWTFHNGSERREIVFAPHLSMNDYAGLVSAMLAGNGIGDLPPIVLPEIMRSGQLVEVMPDWTFEPLDLSMAHLGNRYAPRPVRLFKSFVAQRAKALFPDLPA